MKVIHRRRTTRELQPGAIDDVNGLRASVLALIKLESPRSIKKAKDVSGIRQRQREEMALAICDDLLAGGFAIRSIRGLGSRHVCYLFKTWYDQRQSLGTLQNKRTVLKWLADLSGKHGLVEPLDKYLPSGVPTKRSLVAKLDKSWAAADVDVDEIIATVGQSYPWAATLLKLVRAFGLRRSEAVCFRPCIALTIRDGVQVVWLRKRGWGTKGGRERFVPILSQSQIDVIEEAKSYCDSESAAVMSRFGLSKKAAIMKFKWVVEQAGITKKSKGVTLHGLRHQYYHERILAVDGGMESPIKLTEKMLEINQILDEALESERSRLVELIHYVKRTRWATFNPWDLEDLERLTKTRKEISEELGHDRVEITTAYAGSYATLCHLLRKWSTVIRTELSDKSMSDLAALRYVKPVEDEGSLATGEEGAWDD
ncbi:integrase domain-containing protein [Niveibacterium microcysteis]|uniref:Integrase domain-containing protein n=1 Tax=Niveibacterium microcysteis TaxID=2811415 RepID=A0ABX7MCF6_9RHOO|nr:integrase domain-containing protein [Niveibacterium microcysteis]QSI78190.1 integrase domain-containing protein [Niveibacterium microcysteis]